MTRLTLQVAPAPRTPLSRPHVQVRCARAGTLRRDRRDRAGPGGHFEL
jgi:hypothetical protein